MRGVLIFLEMNWAIYVSAFTAQNGIFLLYYIVEESVWTGKTTNV
jgi:hypothetical protein